MSIQPPINAAAHVQSKKLPSILGSHRGDMKQIIKMLTKQWHEESYRRHKLNYEKGRVGIDGTISIDEWFTPERRSQQRRYLIFARNLIPVRPHDYIENIGKSAVVVMRPLANGKTQEIHFSRATGKIVHKGKPQFLIHTKENQA